MVVSKVSSLSSNPVPAGSGVPGRQRQVYHGSTMAGGESGAAQRSGEEETEHWHMGTDKARQAQGLWVRSREERAALCGMSPSHALGFFKGQPDLKGWGRGNLKIPFV